MISTSTYCGEKIPTTASGLKSEIVTKSVVENAELNVAIAEQTLLSRESALSQASARNKISEIAYQKQLLVVQKAERQLKETEFYAPFNAIISKVSALKGRLITVGERLGTLIDPLALEVSFQVSNADFDKIIDENLEAPSFSKIIFSQEIYLPIIAFVILLILVAQY